MASRALFGALKVSRRLHQEAGKDVPKVLLEPTAKPPSRIRAVFFGFLAGTTATTGLGYYMMRDEILTSSAALKSNVEVIGEGVYNIADQLEKIDLLQAEVTRLKKEAAKKQDLEDVITQVQQEKDELEIALSEHKAFVMESHRDLYAAIETLRSQ